MKGLTVDKKTLEDYFNQKLESEIVVDDEKRQIYAPKTVEMMKNYLNPDGYVNVRKNSKEINDVFNRLQLTDDNDNTQRVLDLLYHQKYHLLGIDTNMKKAINLIFERKGSNYDIFDYGTVSDHKLTPYLIRDRVVAQVKGEQRY